MMVLSSTGSTLYICIGVHVTTHSAETMQQACDCRHLEAQCLGLHVAACVQRNAP